MDIEKKRAEEKQLISLMIKVYQKSQKADEKLCEELEEYAHYRLDKCPFMANKTFCSACKVHCFKADKRAQIKKVMKAAGPRMLFYHPLVVFKHLFVSISEKVNKR